MPRFIQLLEKTSLRVALYSILSALVLPPATAQIARVELHPFPSATLSDEEFLTGQKEGKPVMLAGELRIPRPGTERLPAVVLLHGSGGHGGGTDDWAHWLNDLGVASFVIDSFTARGLVNTSSDQAQLGRLAMVIDAYRALGLLAKHPRIDPERIALMGFSRGGQSALYASLTRFQRMHGPGGVAFAAYIPFYPACNTVYNGDEDVGPRPIRIHHGSADNYVPVAPCRAYVARLRAAGKDALLTEYADAHHVFDGRSFSKPVVPPKAQRTGRCKLEEAAGGIVINSETRQPFTYRDACVDYGPTIAYNAKAHAEAKQALTVFLSSALKLK